MGGVKYKSEKVRRVASIDIGTNTILMLIADIDEACNIYPIADEHAIARLGEGVNETANISEAAIDRAVEILESYRNKITKLKVEKVFAVGTSALRDAKNALQVLKQLEQAIDTRIKVIDGELEAYLSFIGTVVDQSYSVVLDIGGGSTEIIAGNSNKIEFKRSLRVGAVRLTEEFFQFYPPTPNQVLQARNEAKRLFDEIDKKVVKGNVFAVAGTPTTLAAAVLKLKEYDRNKVDGYFLELSDIEALRIEFEQMNVREIVEKFYIHPKRADVILAGTLLLEEFCRNFNLAGIIVSDKGLRYGIIKQKVEEMF